MKFYLGTHKPHWLALTNVPLFVSRRRLAGRKTLPAAIGPWALDSGAFTELSMHGRWLTTATRYVAEVRRFREEIGNMDWAAIQDWPCEPAMREKTSLSVEEHQQRTVASWLELTALAPEVHWVPVLQGWEYADYFRHLEMYTRSGANLASMSTVGLGSVCRRQATGMASEVVRDLTAEGLRLHLFGFKLGGLRQCGSCATSADSMAWSFWGRRGGRSPECTHVGKCTHCMAFALHWREKALAAASGNGTSPQLSLW